MAQQISQKDLMSLTDHLSIEKDHVKMFQDASSQATNPQLKTMFQDISTMHQRHFDILSQHVNKGKMMS